ncbi:MAG: polyprenyl synthetase family protein [Kiritimatiellae bacterium]|nr:polyprenyl synthetase family protein [Kiritimatiellia bacterium]
MIALAEYLKSRRARVEAALLAALPAEGRRPACLTEALRYSVLTGGKRMRPILCLAAAEAAGGSAEDAMHAAVAVELLHTYTLVHDDLPCMDNDLLRRGQPTVHAKFGEAMGVLAGDALQALAFGMLACAPAGRAGGAARLIRELADAAGPDGVVGGQVEDIADAPPADEAAINFGHQHKTADLFRAALRMGALAGGGGDADVDRLGDYGTHLGLAFQIVDDLLDAPADAGAPGSTGYTCLRIWTKAEARQRAVAHTEAAVAALSGLPGPVEPLASLVRELATRSA